MILAVTGHRPDKLGGYEFCSDDDRLINFAIAELRRFDYPPELAIVGMAQGFDQAIASACILEGIPFAAYIPFTGQESLWPQRAKDIYHSILGHAAEKRIVSYGVYEAWKMHARDRAMVDAADTVLALYDGLSKGGTAATVKYAVHHCRPVINCWERWQLFRETAVAS